MHYTGLLAGDQRSFTRCETAEDRRSAEIKIGPWVSGQFRPGGMRHVVFQTSFSVSCRDQAWDYRGDASALIIVQAGLPNLLAGVGIDGVHIGLQISKISNTDQPDCDGCSHACSGVNAQ
jgi:hypothetical protein